MKLRNINPIGHVDVPLLGREGDPLDQEGTGCLQPGEVFDVTEEHARLLLIQPGNYEPADDAAAAVLQGIRDAEAAEEARRQQEQAEADERAAEAAAAAAEAQRQHEHADAIAQAAYEQAYAAALAAAQQPATEPTADPPPAAGPQPTATEEK